MEEKMFYILRKINVLDARTRNCAHWAEKVNKSLRRQKGANKLILLDIALVLGYACLLDRKYQMETDDLKKRITELEGETEMK